MRDASPEVQIALIGWLRGAAAITALVGQRSYDEPPHAGGAKVPETGFPYVALGSTQARPWRMCKGNGSQIVVQIHVWTRSTGKIGCERIAAMIVNLIESAQLSISGYRLHGITVEDKRVDRDPDGRTNHGTIQVRFDLTETPA